MSDKSSKNKLLFDFYHNIKSGIEILSYDDLEIAINMLELAKEDLKTRKQEKIRETEREAFKARSRSTTYRGKVLYLPNGLKKLDANAFIKNEEIVKLVINEGLTEIGEYAFAGCTNLREIIFPKSLIKLNFGCFKDCSHLRVVELHNVLNIHPKTFMNCISLEKLCLPTNMSNIYSDAFKNCRSLKEVVFTKGKFSYFYCRVHAGAFENCTSLEEIDIPKGMSLDKHAFIGCSNLKAVKKAGKSFFLNVFQK